MELSATSANSSACEETSREELKAAENVLAKLVLAMKQANLYPPDHSISREAVQEAARAMRDFAKRYGELILEVRRDGFSYKEHPLSSGTGSKEVAYRCHRDGIEWLVFLPGIEDGELLTFVESVNAHQIIGDEEEGDIVTSLWEAELKSIRYHTDPAVWRNEPLLDLSRFRVHRSEKQQEGKPEADRETDEARSILDSSTDRQLWQLTREEVELTRRMVEDEENRDHTQDIFDVFLILLQQQRTREEVSTALGIVRECFEKALSRGLFRQTSRFLGRFRILREDYAQQGSWALSHVDDFLNMISGSRVLGSLKAPLRQSGPGDLEQLEGLRQTLIRLQPESVEALFTLLPETGSREVQEAIRDAVRELAESDPWPLCRLARYAEPEVALEAVAILGGVARERVPPVLREAAKSGDARIRRAAVRGLIRQRALKPREFLPFLGGPDEEVRNMVFHFLSSERSEEAEEAILEYIRRGGFRRRNAEFLLSLYRVLGLCGTRRSEEFLREWLLSGALSFGGVRAVHRRGAATALHLLATARAREVLREAGESIRPGVRRAARRAGEWSHVGRGKH